MKKRDVKKIFEHKQREAEEHQQAMHIWVVQNMPLAFPKPVRPLFKKAMLKQWNRVMEFFIWLYSVQLRFAKDEYGRHINVAIFIKGELMDSMIKPENNVVKFPKGGNKNDQEKTKAN